MNGCDRVILRCSILDDWNDCMSVCGWKCYHYYGESISANHHQAAVEAVTPGCWFKVLRSRTVLLKHTGHSKVHQILLPFNDTSFHLIVFATWPQYVSLPPYRVSNTAPIQGVTIFAVVLMSIVIVMRDIDEIDTVLILCQ